jgi:hypothetical protein
MTHDVTPEPGEVGDTSLGLSDEEAGNPSPYPPANDVELGEAEAREDLGSDLAEESGTDFVNRAGEPDNTAGEDD